MSEPKFNLFGPITKDDIRVGYISTTRGYIQGVTVCEANSHAKQNPGETFIFKPDRKTVQFLNINQVNTISKLKEQATTETTCPEGINMKAIPDPTKVVFMGGGGVGVVGNPIISDKGRVMGLHLVDGGYGYQYPPVVKIHDDTGVGAGAVVTVGVGTTAKDFYYIKKEYDNLIYVVVSTLTFNFTRIKVEIYCSVGISSIEGNTFQCIPQPIVRGEVTSIHLTENGVGYGSSEILNFNRQPNIDLYTGRNGELLPIVDAKGEIIDVAINNRGDSYNTPPSISVAGVGTGAELVPEIIDAVSYTHLTLPTILLV